MLSAESLCKFIITILLIFLVKPYPIYAREIIHSDDQNPSMQINRIDEALDSIDPVTALKQLLPIAKDGDAVSAFRAGKIYHNHASKFSDPTPNALFWLLYADILGEKRANSILKEYSRNGFRFEMVVIEGRILEELALYKMNKIEKTFPEQAFAEFTNKFLNIFNWLSNRNVRGEALSRLSDMTDVEVCRDAINIKLVDWDEHWRSAGVVDEAIRRKFTIDKCRATLTTSAFSK